MSCFTIHGAAAAAVLNEKFSKQYRGAKSHWRRSFSRRTQLGTSQELVLPLLGSKEKPAEVEGVGRGLNNYAVSLEENRSYAEQQEQEQQEQQQRWLTLKTKLITCFSFQLFASFACVSVSVVLQRRAIVTLIIDVIFFDFQ